MYVSIIDLTKLLKQMLDPKYDTIDRVNTAAKKHNETLAPPVLDRYN